MTDPIRAALERLLQLDDHPDTEWSAWGDAIEAARAALASDGPAVPESREPASVAGKSSDDAELDELFTEIDQSGEALSWRAYARAVLARWGHQPAPLVAGAPGPSMEDVGPLIAWLTEQACQAADASQPADAGMLTWAAQVIGERVNEDAPVAGEVAELVAALRSTADGLESQAYPQTAALITRAADLLEQRHPAPVPIAERLPGPEDCDAEGRCWLFSKVEKEWRLIDAGNPGVPHLKYCFSHWLPAHALPLPQGEVE